MNIQLSEHFTYKKLLRFILPSIIMMVFTSIYSVVDGIFVSNFVGKSAFASVNLIMPYLMGISALGFMIGTGGSAFVSKTLGEGKKELANQYFSMLVTIAAIGGFVLSVLSFIFMRRIVMAFGAAGDLIDYCTLYGRISCISLTAFMLQNVFHAEDFHYILKLYAFIPSCSSDTEMESCICNLFDPAATITATTGISNRYFITNF